MGTAGKDPAAVAKTLMTGILVTERRELIQHLESARLAPNADAEMLTEWAQGWNAAVDQLITTIRQLPLPGDVAWPSCEDVDEERGDASVQTLQQQFGALEHEIAELRQRLARLEQWTGCGSP